MPDATETSLVPVEHAATAVIGPPNPAEWGALKEQIEFIVRANALPAALRGKPADLMLVMLTGRELGIGPVQAISKIHVIDGKPSMSAELMLALVLRNGHEATIERTDNEACVIVARRRGAERSTTFSFTIQDARDAGLAVKDVWKKYPANMLWARCVSKMCRMVFPDVMMGVSYVPEEMGANIDPFTGDPDGSEPLLSEDDAVAIMARIGALSDVYRDQLRDICKERGWVVRRLPERLKEDFLAELEGLEQWDTKGKPPVVPVDDDVVAEAEIVGETSGGDEDGGAAPDVEPAEVVDGNGTDLLDVQATGSPIPRRTTSAKPEPEPEVQPISKARLQRVAIVAREVAAAGLKDDHLPDADLIRHAISDVVSGHRTQSTRELTNDEGALAINLLLKVKDGKKRLVVSGEVGELAEIIDA